MTLTYSSIIKRKVRTDDWNWKELGRSTWTKIKECISKRDLEGALELVDYLLPEGKRIHDAYGDHISGMLTYIAEKFGEEEVYHIQWATADLVIGGLLSMIQKVSVPEYVALLAETMRSHRSGPGELGDIKIREEEDRFIMSFDPCGSGGRIRRAAELQSALPRTEAFYNMGVTKKAYPWSWGKAGVPYYCTHCCIMTEIIAIERIGYPIRITEYDDDPNNDCIWLIYKKKELIPEMYFKRIGKSRPNYGDLRSVPGGNPGSTSKPF